MQTGRFGAGVGVAHHQIQVAVQRREMTVEAVAERVARRPRLEQDPTMARRHKDGHAALRPDRDDSNTPLHMVPHDQQQDTEQPSADCREPEPRQVI
jgi:hypothetical protein